MGGLATSPVLSPGSPTLMSGGQNQKWAHMREVCCVGGPQRFKAGGGGGIRGGPTCGQIGCITPAVSGVPNVLGRETKLQVGPYVTTSSMLSRGSPTLQSRGQRHKWARMWSDWLHHPGCLGGSQRSKPPDKIRCVPTCGQTGCTTAAVSESPLLQSREQNMKRVHMWADWLHHPCCLWGPKCFGPGDKITSGPVCDYIIHAVSGVPNISKQGTTS